MESILISKGLALQPHKLSVVGHPAPGLLRVSVVVTYQSQCTSEGLPPSSARSSLTCSLSFASLKTSLPFNLLLSGGGRRGAAEEKV